MKLPTLLLLASLCLLAALLPPSTAQSEAMAELSGDKQVPPLNTPTSAIWSAHLAGDSMEWSLEVADAQEVTMAHIHEGDAATNGPIIVFLVPMGKGTAADPPAALPMLMPPESGALTFNGTFTSADLGGSLKGKTLQDLIEVFKTPGAYVNVHSTANPSGIVRGQVEWM